MYRILELLPQLYSATLRTAIPVFQTPQGEFQILRTHESGRRLHQSEQTSGKLIVMSDTSFTAAGNAIMIENDLKQKLQSKHKTYAPMAYRLCSIWIPHVGKHFAGHRVHQQ